MFSKIGRLRDGWGSCFYVWQYKNSSHPSMIKGIFRSWYRVWLYTYQGDFAIIFNVFDWYVCSILRFVDLAHPHSFMPYVYTGFSIALHILSLFSRVSWDLPPINQFICFVLIMSWCFFALIVFHLTLYWDGFVYFISLVGIRFYLYY